MFGTVVLFLSSAGAACVEWFADIIAATQSLTFVTGCIAICMAVRYLLIPLVGASIRIGASDTVKKTRASKKVGNTQGSSRRKK